MKILKKWGALILSLLFIIAIAILIIFSKKSLDEYKLAVSERDEQIGTLEASLNDIGALDKGYVLNRDVRAGEMIKIDYFTEVSVPEKLGLGIIKATDDLEGAYFRTSLKEGTVLTTEDINYTEVLDSERYVDVVLDQLPVGVKEGDYIDLRITFPYGEDFIAISGKLIEQINNNILKLKLNENEIVVYNSMLLDRVLYAGTEIRAVTYVDAGSQETAEAFYPINQSQSELLLQNPNALELSKQEMILKRQQVETTLGANGLTITEGMTEEEIEEQLDIIQDRIEALREKTQDRVSSANEIITERRAAEAEAAAAAENGETVDNGVSF